MSELKKCPFCGGEAGFYRSLSVIGDIVTVRCKACQTKTAGILFDARKHQSDEEYDEAAALWNNRKPVVNVLERLEKDMHPVYNAEWNRAIKKAIDIIREELM